MDRKLPENPEIQRLIRLSEASRACLESEAAALRHRLDVPTRIRSSLRDHPSAWLFGSVASGLAASLMFRRRPAEPKKRRGFPGKLLGLTLTAAQPLAKIWLSGQLKQLAASSLAGTSQSAPQTQPLKSTSPAHVSPSGSGSR